MKTKSASKKLLGGLFLFVACLLAFLWFYWLAPFRHLHSSEWIGEHSTQGRWIEEQIDVGRFGDKGWTEWTIRQISSVNQGNEVFSCGIWPYHLTDAIPDMTNQSLTNEAGWIGWWETNKNKTQVEWIREGFAERGLILQDPLTTNNIIDLLKLAHLTTNSPAYTNTPDYLRGSLRLNAFRWLQDSGINFRDAFSVWDYDVNNIPEEDRNRITAVLLDYAMWYGENWDGPGKLLLKKDYVPLFHFQYELAFQKCKWVVYFTIPLLTLVGIWLVRRQSTK